MSKCHVCGGTKEFEGLCLEDDDMSELKPCPFKKCDWYDRDLECTLYYKRDYENCTVKKLESKLKEAEDKYIRTIAIISSLYRQNKDMGFMINAFESEING